MDKLPTMCRVRSSSPPLWQTKVAEILDRVASGESLQDVCTGSGGFPTVSQFLSRVYGEEQLRSDFIRARVLQGEALGQRSVYVSRQAEKGELPPKLAEVANKGYQWAAARLAPKLWGDRHTIEIVDFEGRRTEFQRESDELVAMLYGSSQIEQKPPDDAEDADFTEDHGDPPSDDE